MRESDAGAIDGLPDRPISPHPNFVTASGLLKIESQLQQLDAALAVALAASDRGAVSGIERDLRYWRQRRSSARIIAAPAAPEIVRFGVTVSLRQQDGVLQQYQLVGEDEADPAAGLISWTSPVGSALIGRRSGELVELAGRPAQIIAMQA